MRECKRRRSQTRTSCAGFHGHKARRGHCRRRDGFVQPVHPKEQRLCTQVTRVLLGCFHLCYANDNKSPSQPPQTCMCLRATDTLTEGFSLKKNPLSSSGSTNIFSLPWGLSGDSQAKPNEDLIFRGMGVRDEGVVDAADADDAHSQTSASSRRSRRSLFGGFAQTEQTPSAVSSTRVFGYMAVMLDAACFVLRTQTSPIVTNVRVSLKETRPLSRQPDHSNACVQRGSASGQDAGDPHGMDGGENEGADTDAKKTPLSMAYHQDPLVVTFACVLTFLHGVHASFAFPLSVRCAPARPRK